MDKKQKMPKGRKRNLVVVTTIFVVLGLIYGAYWALVLRHQESTDDAYVGGHVVQITPEISGTVLKVVVEDTQQVRTGQVLLSLDDKDARLAFERSRHELEQAIRQARQLMINTQQLSAQIKLRQAELTRAQADLQRRQQLAGTEALAAEELAHAKDAVASANAALDVAKEQYRASVALVGKDNLAQQPSVKAAASRFKEAWLALQRTQIKSPVDGVVARRNVQPGQRLAAGTPLMAVVPLHQLWVDANFKEGQLAKVRLGQPVVIKADLYGSKVIYHGTVQGLSAGTGSAFSLLPAQNATGNWIKVVQRVPVRIQLDPKDLKEHPLRIGLSMEVEVDTAKGEGKSLAEAPRFAPVPDSQAHLPDLAQADQLIKQLLSANAADGADF